MTVAPGKPRPTRTCLACRQAKPKAGLARLVRRADGVVILDALGRAPGRGAYVCVETGCSERGLERERLSHAFRKRSEAGATLAEEVRQLWQRRR